jgi:hypothetical protein
MRRKNSWQGEAAGRMFFGKNLQTKKAKIVRVEGTNYEKHKKSFKCICLGFL